MSLLTNFLKHGENEYAHKKLGLGRMHAALAQLEHPEKTYPTVLIGGTNGKGSVGRMLEAVLQAAGHRVGLYSSPHLVRFTERIRIAGDEVSDEQLEKVLSKWQVLGLFQEDGALQIASGEMLSWFEKTTLLAFEAFRQLSPDIVILEVGLGGRLDATNVVDPLLSVITSISKDHTEVLGDSLFEIAREKLAIARSHRPLIVGLMDPNVRSFILEAARMQEVKPVTPFIPKGSGERFSYGPFDDLSLKMLGRHQLFNAATAIETVVALKELGFLVDNRALRQGLATAQLPGRMELLGTKPEVLFDGAHNEAGLQELVHYLRSEHGEREKLIIFGMVVEKDHKQALRILAGVQSPILFTEVPSPRTVRVEAWERFAGFEPGLDSWQSIVDPETALASAQKNISGEGLIVVTGSLYLVGKLRTGKFIFSA